MVIKLHFGDRQKWHHEDKEGFKCMRDERREVSSTFLNMYRKWDFPIWTAKLMLETDVRR